jgi:predicted nucleotidyltransferase
MDNATFTQLLKELADTKVVRVTGSFADGTQHEDSDIDFRVKPNKPDYRFYDLEPNIKKVINVLKKYGLKLGSTSTGYVHTHNLGNELPYQIELSDLFWKRQNKLKEVEIMGVTFNTY